MYSTTLPVTWVPKYRYFAWGGDPLWRDMEGSPPHVQYHPARYMGTCMCPHTATFALHPPPPHPYGVKPVVKYRPHPTHIKR